MCSIAGGENTEWMLEVMKHRAPDGVRVTQGDFPMGMGRLAIFDTENQEFPMTRQGHTIVFNGAIYNFEELKFKLEGLGYNFTTKTDTEVLLTAYLAWGDDCLKELNGMFAFAISDGETVFFARDVAGEKPFYYQHQPFRFASEAKALGWRCNELPPGWCGKFHVKTNQLSLKKWWRLAKRQFKNFDDACVELEELLGDAVRLRTKADVPYGLYLSDGVDSNLIATYHNFANTFTYYDSIATKEEFFDVFEKIVWHLDYPVSSFSAFALWKLAEEARGKGVKVVLSGEGADEIFGGYVRYVPNAMNLKARAQYPSYSGMFPYEGDLGWRDFKGSMQELLRMGDRMASAHGVENRCPFLDKRIIQFGYSLPPEWKCYGDETKIILRHVLRKRNPEYREVEKHGLYVSVNRWFDVDDRLTKRPYLEAQQKIWQKYQS